MANNLGSVSIFASSARSPACDEPVAFIGGVPRRLENINENERGNAIAADVPRMAAISCSSVARIRRAHG